MKEEKTKKNKCKDAFKSYSLNLPVILFTNEWSLWFWQSSCMMNGDSWNICFESTRSNTIADVLLKLEFIKNKPQEKFLNEWYKSNPWLTDHGKCAEGGWMGVLDRTHFSRKIMACEMAQKKPLTHYGRRHKPRPPLRLWVCSAPSLSPSGSLSQ